MHRLSNLMPEWMQIRFPIPAKNPDVEGYLHPKKNIPVRSVFSFMHGSHNVSTKEDAEKATSRMNSKETFRIYQWDENTAKQRYDSKPITGKIGYNN